MNSTLLLAGVLITSKQTVWEKLKAVPTESWINFGVAIICVTVIVKLWKNLREVGEIVPWIVLVLMGGSVVLYTTYERCEPKVLTPIFNELARILPSKIEYKDPPVKGQ
jgi:di/tricarboxylate transporter